MKSEDIVLGILSEHPASGYEIKQIFSTIFSNFYNASFGSIYPILHRLEKQERVTATVLSQEGKPNKKVYFITDKGAEDFNNFLRSAIEPEKIKWDFMVRLYYAKRLAPLEQKELLMNEIKQREQEIKELKELKNNTWDTKMDIFQKLSFELGIKQKKLMVSEIKNFLSSLEDIQNKL